MTHAATLPGSRPLKAALIGNPNCGKTSLFNALTGLNQRVGNFPGVTVDRKAGSFSSGGRDVRLVDLPGTYSLQPRSLDERVAAEVILDRQHPDYPDLSIIVADSTRLRTGLYIALQVIEQGIPSILVLNMADELEQSGSRVDAEGLSKRLGIPVVLTDARSAKGMDGLRQTIGTHPLDRPEAPWMADGTAAAGRHRVIREMLDAFLTEHQPAGRSLTQRIDDVLTHRLWGFAIFLGLLAMVFQSIFAWAEYPMEAIEAFFSAGSAFFRDHLPAGFLTDLWTEGIWAGLGGVMVFIPQIALLFLFVAIMEDTGYMARVSFITDRALRPFGLQGRSVVALMGGVACAVPAILSARTIANWRERLLTILVTPFMTCSARLPVYVLLISLTIPEGRMLGFLTYQGLTMLGMYVLGTVAALGASFVVSRFVADTGSSRFIMELPIYRAPRWRNVALEMARKVSMFATQAGKVIVGVAVVLWLGASYGPIGRFDEVNNRYDAISAEGHLPDEEAERLRNAELLENSYIGIAGRAIEPAIAPLGYDWKIGIALITSFAAREVFVGTMATIYSVGDSEDTASIRDKMRSRRRPGTDEPLYGLPFGLSLLVFYAFAMQCASTLAVVRAETGSWRWPLLQLLGMTGLAYVCAWGVFRMAGG